MKFAFEVRLVHVEVMTSKEVAIHASVEGSKLDWLHRIASIFYDHLEVGSMGGSEYLGLWDPAGNRFGH